MDQFIHLNIKNLDSLDSPFHQNLLASLGDIIEQLQQLVTEADSRSVLSPDDRFLGGGILEVLDAYNYAMGGLHTFLSGLDSEASVLDRELDTLEAKRQELLQERDTLIEKAHELNCRLGYNALERKLDETFTSLEKYTTEESAKCFRDEADENLKRTNDLIRIGNMTSCQIDRDMFREMEKITNLFENYERERDHYVKELDLFSDVRRQRITTWLAGSRSEEEREKAENILDYLNLSQRQRHMESQIIKNALRMYSFNASLNFDREDNLKMMEELTSLQNKINSLSGVSVTLPRLAKARTNLIAEEEEQPDDRAGGDGISVTMTGKGLHRCPRRSNLATDPITDPVLVGQLEAALRWEDKEEKSIATTTHEPADSLTLSEHQEVTLTESSSDTTETAVKALGSVCGDREVYTMQLEPPMEIAADEGKMTKTGNQEMNPCCTHTFLRHIESPTVLSHTAERQMVGLVRKKHSGRHVGSLTDVLDAERDTSSQRLASGESEERDTRSQGNEPTTRAVSSGNKSREHVPNLGGSTDKE